MQKKYSIFVGVLVFALIFSVSLGTFANEEEKDWIPLFNGKDLKDWKVKIRNHELGDNYKNTFRVEDGLLKVSYDEYDQFNNRFGHIFYKEKFSHYLLRVEYRFIGEQMEDGAGWAFRNSGIMLHCQPPKTMTKDQDFPVSIEVQLLGGGGSGERTTGNLCTPGTHVEMEGELITQHCTSSSSETYHGDQWVTVMVEVHGNEVIKHIIDDDVVLQYEKPQLDTSDNNTKHYIEVANIDEKDTMIHEGYISLQSESHPVEFRKVEILPLK